jgi:hypothetical protein
MRMTRTVLVLSCGLALAAPLAADVSEPKTGVTFSERLEGTDQVLLGVGLRVKKITFIKVSVYAVGLYVSEAALKGPLASQRGKPPSPELFKLLQWGDFDKTLVLRFVRDVGERKVQDAMREALAQDTDPKILDIFVSFFPEVRNGGECRLSWLPGGRLEATMLGQRKPAIADKSFAAAVFGLYVGEHPLQEDIRAGLVARLAERRE